MSDTLRRGEDMEAERLWAKNAVPLDYAVDYCTWLRLPAGAIDSHQAAMIHLKDSGIDRGRVRRGRMAG